MNVFGLWGLFHRPGQHTQQRTSMLAVIAFAAATALFLTVLGGVHAFIWRGTGGCMYASGCRPNFGNTSAHSQYTQDYVMLAVVACVLLIVPFTTLAGAAARLAASRRDARLAALRLAGATNGQVIALTALDAASQALIGALIGIAGYVALMPLVMLLNFQNASFTFQELWVGPLTIIAALAGVTLLALVSSLITLRRVIVTPLGVTQRAATALPTVWRAVIFVTVMAVAFSVLKTPSLYANMGTAVVMMVVVGTIFLCFALMNLIGTWLVSARARARARRPKDAATMIAMRRILDNPKRAWRNVSGIALAVFIAGITSVASYVSSSVDASARGVDPAFVMFLRDIGTGGLLTLAFAAVLAAVSCGVMQAGNVYDQVGEYRMLMLEGTDVQTLNRARFVEVLTPLRTVVLVAAACAMLLMLPIFASAMIKPVTLLSFFLGIAGCFVLVSIGAFTSNRVAAGLNLTGYRADD